MRRLALLAGSFSAGIFLSQYLLPGRWLLPAALVCLLAGAGALALKGSRRTRALLCCAGLALAFGWNWRYCRCVSGPMEALADTQQTLELTLTEYPTAARFGAKVTAEAEGLPGKLA